MASTVQLSTRAFVTKKEIREAIFVENAEADRTDDELNTLYNFVNWVSESIEAYCSSPVIQQTITEYNDGGGEYVFLTTLPVVSITSVTEEGVALQSDTAFVYDPDLAAVRRVSDTDVYVASTFLAGTKIVKVEYKAGYGTQTRAPVGGELTSVSGVPEDFKLAAYTWIQTLWSKGPANYSPQVGNPSGFAAAIPYQVKELLRNRVLHVHWIGM
jgi:hypothetical protein